MIDKPTVSISKLFFSGGKKIEFSNKDKVIIVGSNNSGKSQTLKEIIKSCSSERLEHNLVIKDINLSKQGSLDHLKKFLAENADYSDNYYKYNDWSLHFSHIDMWNNKNLASPLLPGFMKIISANDRLSICFQQSSISTRDQKSKPQHILYDDDSLMHKISSLFKIAFGKELIIDFRGGSKIPIHVGDKYLNKSLSV